MISKCLLVCALATCALVTPSLGSAIKGYSSQRNEASKTSYLHVEQPIEQHQQVKQTKLEHVEQQREEHQQPLVEQQREEIQQQKEVQQATSQLKEEAPPVKAPLRYEAKPQVGLEEQKGGFKFEQVKQRVEQVEQAERVEQVQQVQQVRDAYESQQQVAVEEQRRYEEQPLVQPILPLTVIEETRGQQVKGAAQQQVFVGEPEPYAFSYQVDGSSRSESGDTKGVVRGQYSVQNADGSSRIVDYVADHNGYRATVNTNEFGTESKSPASVALRSSQPSAEDITLRLEGKTKEEHLAAGLKGSAPLPAPPAIKAPLAQLPLEEAKGAGKRAPLPEPIKGQRLVQQEEQHEEQYQAGAKSAELRSPKLIGELKLAPQARSGFESATAHRALYRAPPTYVARPAPAIAVRPQPPVALVRGPVPAVSRAHLQRERYPPTPVQGGYRRQPYYHDQVVPANPRVSFYSPSSGAHFDDEQPNFEQPEA